MVDFGDDPHTLEIGQPVELTWIERNGVPFAAFRPAGSQ
jgi:uncharacterized OB-fold protein